MPQTFLQQEEIYEPPRRSGLSFAGVFGFLIFLASAIITGGLFIAQRSLEARMNTLQEGIVALEEEFDIPLINKLLIVDSKIKKAEELIENHTYLSNVFYLL